MNALAAFKGAIDMLPGTQKAEDWNPLQAARKVWPRQAWRAGVQDRGQHGAEVYRRRPSLNPGRAGLRFGASATVRAWAWPWAPTPTETRIGNPRLCSYPSRMAATIARGVHGLLGRFG